MSRPADRAGGKPAAIVLGTRPELIKMAHVIRLLGEGAVVLHTGQHYTGSLYKDLADDLGVSGSIEEVRTPPLSRGRQLGTMVDLVSRQLADRDFGCVVVQGDTTSALAGALAANAAGLPLVHVESGLRSRDRSMPEEHNRVLIDHLADHCCVHTELARDNLRGESIDDSRILMTGNPVIEVLKELCPSPERTRTILERRGLTPGGYLMATFHRPENVDDPEAVRSILTELAHHPMPVLLPCHPRTLTRLEEFGLTETGRRAGVTAPLPYDEFLGLVSRCALVVSDSGGLQEEVSVLKRPMLVVRRSTERPEIMGSFGTLVPWQEGLAEHISEYVRSGEAVRRHLAGLPSPYGDGDASRRIAALVSSLSAPQSEPGPEGGQASPQSVFLAAR